MQIKIYILLVLIGLVTSVHIDTLAKTSSNQAFISSFFQKNELKGNTTEGLEGVKVLEKMIKDLDEKETDLHKKAKTDLDKCTNEYKKLKCQDQDTWQENIDDKNGDIKQWEKDNDKIDEKILQLNEQKDTLDKNHKVKKEEDRQKIIKNYENILKMIKKIIKVMVDTYKVTTSEDLSGIQSFVQTEQLIELKRDMTALTSHYNQDHFAQIANLYMNQAITALIEKRYDSKSAQKFVKLMEALTAKLRDGLENTKNNFKYPDSQLKSDHGEIDAKIKAEKNKQSQNNLKIENGIKANKINLQKIEKCQKAAGHISKCKEEFESATTLADADDDLLRILKQVQKDTKALLGIVDEQWDTVGLEVSKVADSDATTWISEQIENRVGKKKATLCYRYSRDGGGASTFHKNCDSKGASITIIKTTKRQIIGGYNPQSFGGAHRWLEGSGAWLFSYNRRNVATQKFGTGTFFHTSKDLVSNFGVGDLYFTGHYSNNHARIGNDFVCPYGNQNNSQCKQYYTNDVDENFHCQDYEVYILK